MINLMHGECIEKMKHIEPGTVDMILTDPPYEVDTKGAGMMKKDNRKFMEEVENAKINTGINVPLFLNNCLDLFTEKNKYCGVFFCSMKQLIKYMSWAELNKFQYKIGVWHKSNPAPLCNCKYLNDVEYWIYIKGNKSKILGSYESKSMVYKSQINKCEKAIFNHPTIKPVILMEKFIINHTEEGFTVLDPFMGSGSTGVAATNLNRSFIGIELNHEYYKTAYERILNELCFM